MEMYKTAAAVNAHYMSSAVKDVCSLVLMLLDGRMALPYFADFGTDLIRRGCAIGEKYADFMQVTSLADRTLNQPDSFEPIFPKQLESFLQKRFPERDVLKKALGRVLESIFVKVTTKSIGKPRRDGGVAGYTSANRISTLYLYKCERRL